MGDADVLIAGAGPVGLALATLLGARGVSSVIVDPRPAATDRDESRAITWMPEGLLAADEMGITEALRARSVVRRWHEFRADPRGRPLLTLDMSRLQHRHPYTLNLPQGDSERVMESAALATGAVTVRRGWRVTTASTSGPTTVEADLEGPDGLHDRVVARFGVACDGAASPRRGVAAMLGIGEDFSDYGAHSVVADLQLTADPAPTDRSWIALAAERPLGAFCFGTHRWRLVYRVNEGESAEVTSERFVEEQLRRAYPEAVVDRHLWASSFRLGQGQSHRYWHGRWALAGDAAHAMGPSAGAGMQLGVLGAWRLSQHLLAGLADDSAWPREAARYELTQRRAARAVQRSNARIFRSMTVTSTLLSAVRSTMLSVVGRVRPVADRMTADAALAGLAPRPAL